MSLVTRSPFGPIVLFLAGIQLAQAADTTVPVCSILHPAVYSVGQDSHCTHTSIQAAIDDVVCPNTTIVITAEFTFSAQHLSIANKDLTLIGTSGACGQAIPPSTAASPALDGVGNGGQNVIDITGASNVTVQNLDITGGHASADDSGGGIHFQGSGSLTLKYDTIADNYAGYGGGIDIDGDGAEDATLTINEGTLILANTAQISGGGVRVEHGARMFMLQAGTSIAYNTALGTDTSNNPSGGYGGGVELVAGIADIGSSGDVFVSAVSNNTAPYGGGMAIIDTNNGSSQARIFTTDPTTPVRISENRASVQGGAFYLDRQGDQFGAAVLCAYNFQIDSNSAPDGAAFYVTSDTEINSTNGSSVSLNPAGNCYTPSVASLGSVKCEPGLTCNEIAGNETTDAQGNITDDGSVITLNAYQTFDVEALRMYGNHAARMINATTTSNFADYHLINCLITDNHSVHELIKDSDSISNAKMAISNCTFANNLIDDGSIFFAIGFFNLTNTILFQNNAPNLDHQDGDCGGNCVTDTYILYDDARVPLGQNVGTFDTGIFGVPNFVDANNSNTDKRDYHLTAFLGQTPSLGLDFAPREGGVDIDGTPRDQDVPGVDDPDLPRDVGAYEMQPIIDRIFANAFGDKISILF